MLLSEKHISRGAYLRMYSYKCSRKQQPLYCFGSNRRSHLFFQDNPRNSKCINILNSILQVAIRSAEIKAIGFKDSRKSSLDLRSSRKNSICFRSSLGFRSSRKWSLGFRSSRKNSLSCTSNRKSRLALGAAGRAA